MSPPQAPAKKRAPPVYRQIRAIPLVYDQIVEADIPEGALILGIHAQPTGGVDEQGLPRQKYVRSVDPQLMYVFTAQVPLVHIRILLLRGQADLPLDPDHDFGYLGSTVDKNPRLSGFATAWQVVDR
ncbi:MAG TPA: hypothetical protein VF653_13245 [Methylomirabilota bacterium]